MARHTLLLVALAVSMTAFGKPSIARAQTEQAHTAQALFDEGRTLMSQTQYAAACPKFLASHRLDPAVGTLLNLAHCWKNLGKTASAWTAYRDAASLAHWQNQPQREAFARAEAAAIEPHLARLVVNVADSENVALEVRRDGTPVPRDAWGMATPVDPGQYTIEASAPGRRSFSVVVRVERASTEEVTVPSLEAAPEERPQADRDGRVSSPKTPPAKPPAKQPALPREQPAPDSSVLWPLTVAVAAVGLAAFGVAGFFALRMRSEDAAARKICPIPGEECTEPDVREHRARQDAARANRTAAYVSAGIGAACALGAGALYIADTASRRSSGRTSPQGFGVVLGAHPEGFMMGAQGSF